MSGEIHFRSYKLLLYFTWEEKEESMLFLQKEPSYVE